MKITKWALDKRTVTYVLAIFMFLGGVYSYIYLGRLEFPPMTVKTAVVATTYPGASPEEVEQEVTDPLEKAIQEMAQIKDIRSISQAGQSIIYVDIKLKYSTGELPQIWDELRRKVNDQQAGLPSGAGPSVVNDDFGDEYGVFFALYGDGYSYQELKHYADFLNRELLLIKDVASVSIWGNQQQVINLEISRARMAELGISLNRIFDTLNRQNQVVSAGEVTIGDDEIRLSPTGEFTEVEDLGELLVQADDPNHLVYLKDVVTISRGYQDPPRWMMRYNGKPAVGIGISTVTDGNVVEMGRAVKKRLEELQTEIPVGIEIGTIAYQGATVSESLSDFIVNLIEAVVIVIIVLCVTMGLASGLLMGAILLFTIFGTFIVMRVMNINLQLISLGALILSLGMLVDNAIVVTEGILIRIQQGSDRRKAALDTVAGTAWPLLGATVVAILAFAAIGTSRDMSGEFVGSLFKVMAISLGLSWILAITLTPLFCVKFLPEPKKTVGTDPYAGRIYRGYRRLLDMALSHRPMCLLILVMMLAGAVWSFQFIKQSFFPNSKRPQFLVDYWRPEGTSIKSVSEDLKKLETYILDLDHVTATTTFIGQGALRFLLTYEPQSPNSSYGQILVTVDDYREIDGMLPDIRAYITEKYPDSLPLLFKFQLGPGKVTKIGVRFQGPDKQVLRQLAEEAKAVMAADPDSTDIKDDWRQRVNVLRPVVAEANARRLGLTRPMIAETLAMNFSGKAVGVYREENELIPLMVRAPAEERADVGEINNLVVFSGATGRAVPLSRVVTGVQSVWEDPIIHRRNRQRTITVESNPLYGNATALLNRIRPKIEAIPLPVGYKLQWGGEFETQNEAQGALLRMVPVFFLGMVVIVLFLYNAIRQTVIVFLCIPMIVIGVASGLLISGEPFGFMCLLGFLGLSGMIIKNAVVLIDQIDMDIASGKNPYQAVLDSSVSRVRPVSMAALTTVLGMVPLLMDVFYAGMAVTIVGGLAFGTILTLVVVPVLYTAFFRIGKKNR